MFKYNTSKDAIRTFTFDHSVQSNPDIINSLIEIEQDRYRGAYSGFAYTAWVGSRPDIISSSYPICEEFWKKWRDLALYGGGETPQEAFNNLVQKLDNSDFGIIDRDSPDHGSLRVILVYLSNACYPEAFIYNSPEFKTWIGS